MRSASAPAADGSAETEPAPAAAVRPSAPPRFFRRSVAALVGRNISQYSPITPSVTQTKIEMVMINMGVNREP